MKLQIQKSRPEADQPMAENSSAIEIPIESATSNESKIEQIKSELVNCQASPEMCKAEVIDMWDEIDEKTA